MRVVHRRCSDCHYAENVLVHSLRVLLLLLRVLVLLQLLLEERTRAMMACVVLLRRT
jgi:hypothetical protein